MSDLLPGYDLWLDAPYQQRCDAEDEEEEVELDGLEEEIADDEFGDY